jgi:hypothetical protein
MTTPVLPDADTAKTESAATLAAAIATAEATFVAQVTVLIDNAIANGLYCVQPYLDPLVTSDYVTGYFSAPPLNYVVLYPVYPLYPYNTMIEVVQPQVLPPGYQQPYTQNQYDGPPRIQISWS